jgi:hypothetical protein
MVRLVRRVQHAASDVGAEVSLPRADDRVERGHRAARREESPGLEGKVHPVAQPVERVGFELHERRRGLPHARIPVRRGGDEVCERRSIEAAAGNEGQIAGTGRVERARDPVAEQLIEQRLERDAALRRALTHRAADLGRIHVAACGLPAK